MTFLTRRASLKLALGGTAALPLLLAGTRPARAAAHTVTIEGFAFAPAALAVSVGDTVTFTNNDNAPHTATGDGFDTGRLRRGQSATVTISAAGTLAYRCQFHPNMRGTIQAG